ncbi:L,D-transpeptidase [Bacteriovorax stolpii]|uniref:L,D-transpeptidase n=1 Tax=Bacteriovorax stolpii TaxID=960 RepID=A0A2K9NSB3_BACTC|nr:L,D-transpeptidase [Bacteriovorax stolpii]AUN97985.1 L,D-transpeptidase [Bacteriovorax stolpii]TDP51819.1 L,D-transpeptidase-like protein [Bacteriovorax stolpii]
MKSLVLSVFVICSLNLAHGAESVPYNILDELNPRDPQIEEILQYYDERYTEETGQSPFIGEGGLEKGWCYQSACPVWARIIRAEQMMYLYIDGVVTYVWLVSTGMSGYRTPAMDQNPNGRIYDRYSSTTWPGGDYNGLGNMPYAVFIYGGYAIHGTTRGNWPMLGKPASHGCIRLHPDNAFIFNRMVRNTGVGSVWVTVE